LLWLLTCSMNGVPAWLATAVEPAGAGAVGLVAAGPFAPGVLPPEGSVGVTPPEGTDELIEHAMVINTSNKDTNENTALLLGVMLSSL
jgi:hypothetical protein